MRPQFSLIAAAILATPSCCQEPPHLAVTDGILHPQKQQQDPVGEWHTGRC